jgi:hypothetical protein
VEEVVEASEEVSKEVATEEVSIEVATEEVTEEEVKDNPLKFQLKFSKMPQFKNDQSSKMHLG